jgi:hypothetical protein
VFLVSLVGHRFEEHWFEGDSTEWRYLWERNVFAPLKQWTARWNVAPTGALHLDFRTYKLVTSEPVVPSAANPARNLRFGSVSKQELNVAGIYDAVEEHRVTLRRIHFLLLRLAQ